jgi:CheY-like chemotaxis protein
VVAAQVQRFAEGAGFYRFLARRGLDRAGARKMLAAINMPARRILIVDDEHSVCEVTKLLVEMGGHTAVCVTDAPAALREMAAQPCDAIIIDMLMPEMDGVELINEVRRLRAPPRIIAMSGGGHIPKESYLQIAHMAGAHALLPKPFNREQVERVLAEAFGESVAKS